MVPAGSGSVTWDSTLKITRGIHLQGPGRNQLTITRGAPMIQISPSATALLNSETFTLSGFTFDYNNASTPGLSPPAQAPIMVDGPSTAPVFQRLIIVDNRVRNLGTETFAIRVAGQVRGVIAANDFDRCCFIIQVMGNDTWSEWEEFGPTRAFGTADNLYFEDNTIHYSSSYGIADPGWTEVGHAGRLVVRYNSWDMTNADEGEYWDVHGSQSGVTGSLISEYYGNSIRAVSPYSWASHRGGWGLYFNNIMVNGGARFQIYNKAGSCDMVSTLHPTQIQNTYFWNNTAKGVEQSDIFVYMDACVCTGDWAAHNGPLALNKNYFALNTSFNGTTQHGIGRGTSAPVGSCTNPPRIDYYGEQVDGDAYWVAPTPTPTVDPATIQAGRLYKYINGSWRVYYAPYTYPHPLRGAGTRAPAPPTSVIIR